jgi:hypothetical protein
MHHFVRYLHNLTPFGSIVVKLYWSGDEVRAYIREAAEEEADETIFPSEELEPTVAFRLAANKCRDNPHQPIYIELAEGVEWNPEWGAL